MPLVIGSRLGAYEVVSANGAGGMGEVYRARDLTLRRDVALKVLPGAFAADPERLARFEREAQVLAALNHPNIAQVHGIESSGDVRALVMEFVDGDDLARRLAGGALSIDEALGIARQIAFALEAAQLDAHRCVADLSKDLSSGRPEEQLTTGPGDKYVSLDDARVIRANIRAVGPGFESDAPRVFAEVPVMPVARGPFDVAADGRLLLLERTINSAALSVVTNWRTLMK